MNFCGFNHLRQALEAQEPGLVNEVKFVGDETLADQAMTLMDACCLPDSEFPVGHIHSIYFDSPHRYFHSEKVDGDNLKLKVRIRWYGRPGPLRDGEIPTFIEAKHRLGSARRKHRIAVPAPERWINEARLDDPALPAFLYRHAGAFGEAIPLNLIPVVCISYERRRYLCPQTGSRIAVDRRIQANRINAREFPSVSRIQVHRTVCEFKNQGKAPPSWSQALYQAGFRLRSFSKYGECLNQVLHGGAPT